MAVALLAVFVIWTYARQERARSSVLVAFGAILGGAVGNLVDRLRLGFVEDFILVHWGTYEWPAFNVADTAVTMGGIALFIALARDNDDVPDEPEDAPGDLLVDAPPPAGDDA